MTDELNWITTQKKENEEFRSRLDMLMGDDNPTQPHPDRVAIEAELDAESVRRGFDNWLDAWHRYSPRESELDALMRIAYVSGK